MRPHARPVPGDDPAVASADDLDRAEDGSEHTDKQPSSVDEATADPEPCYHHTHDQAMLDG